MLMRAVFDAEKGACGAEDSALVWKRPSLVRRPLKRMAPLFRIMDEGSSGVEKVALI